MLQAGNLLLKHGSHSSLWRCDVTIPISPGSEEGGGDFPWGGWKNKALTRAEHWATAAPVRAGGQRRRRSSTSESSRRRAGRAGPGQGLDSGAGAGASLLDSLPPPAEGPGDAQAAAGVYPHSRLRFAGGGGRNAPAGRLPAFGRFVSCNTAC